MPTSSAPETDQNRGFLRTIAFGCLCALGALLSFTKISDDDVFWQLATGRWIVQHWAIPDHDVFGFITGGVQWFPVEWLWGVLLFGAYTLFHGYLGLAILTTIILTGTVWFQLRTMRILDMGTPLITAIILLTLLTMLGRIAPRPQIVTTLGLSAITFIIYQVHQSKNVSPKIFIGLPILFIVWANMHPGVLAGLTLLALALVAEAINLFLMKRGFTDATSQSASASPLKFRQLLLLLLFCSIASLTNPHGIGTYIYVYNHAHMNFLNAIYEWDSPFTALGVMDQVWFYMVFLVLSLTTLFVSYRKKDVLPAVLSVAFAVYSFQAIRLIGDFAIVTAPGTALGIRELLDAVPSGRFKKLIRGTIPSLCLIILLIAFICSIPTGQFYPRLKMQEHPGIGIDSSAFPLPMMGFIRQEAIEGRPFNEFGIGGLYLWEFPEMKNFIDSRDLNDTIGYLFTSMYNLQPGFERKFAAFGIDHIMTYIPGQDREAGLMAASPIPYFSTHRDDWRLVFWDDRSTLYLKNIPKFRSIIERYEYKVLHPYLFAYRPRDFDSLRIALPGDFQLELQRKIHEEPGGRIIRFIQSTMGQNR